MCFQSLKESRSTLCCQGKGCVTTGDDEKLEEDKPLLFLWFWGLCVRQVLYHWASFVLFEFRDRVSWSCLRWSWIYSVAKPGFVYTPDTQGTRITVSHVRPDCLKISYGRDLGSRVSSVRLASNSLCSRRWRGIPSPLPDARIIGLCHQAKDMVLRFSDIITPAWASLKFIAWVLLLCLYCFSQRWDDWLKMSPTFKNLVRNYHFPSNRLFIEKLQLCLRILLK